MTKRKATTDPATIFRIYCDEYRRLEPQVYIPETFARRIDAFIDDVVYGRTITPFDKIDLSMFGPSPGSMRCSIYFIEYLRKLSTEMKRQQHFTVSPTRACELLYNQSADEIYTPAILRMKLPPDGYFLKSMAHHPGRKLSLRVDSPSEYFDWTLSR